MIPLEKIANEYREVYRRLVEMDNGWKNCHLVNSVFINSNFYAYNFLEWFNNKGFFSSKQMKFINNVYSRIGNYKATNNKFIEEGHKDQLLNLMYEVAENAEKGHPRTQLRIKTREVEKGRLIYGRYFAIIENCLECELKEKYSKRLEDLKTQYWDIFNELKGG